MMSKKRYLTASEAAHELGFTATHVRRLIYQGRIKAVKIGNQWMIEPRAIKGIERVRNSADGIS